jgi:formylglycine-generating enzyme required for sulfatase activity
MSGQIPLGRRTTKHTLAVEAAEALPSGIRGMFGNTSEWVADWWGAQYLAGQRVINPTGPTKSGYRHLRGGLFSSDFPDDLRVARTNSGYPPHGGSDDKSFRLVFAPRK